MNIKEKIGIGIIAVLLAWFGWSNVDVSLSGSAVVERTFTSANISTAVSVTSSTQVIATSSRLYAIICNDSSNVVYLNLDEDKAASNAKGIRLNASGGCYEINRDNLYVGAVQASSTGEATSSLLVTEFK